MIVLDILLVVVGGYLAGRAAVLIRLQALLGMLVYGIVIGPFMLDILSDEFVAEAPRHHEARGEVPATWPGHRAHAPDQRHQAGRGVGYVRFICHGGCPRDRFRDDPYGEPGHNYLCAGFKAFFGHVTRPMRAMEALLKANRPAAEIMYAYAAEDAARGRNDECFCLR